jgi:hypothetical protein
MVCHVMHWSYADLLALPADVYDEAVKFVNKVLSPPKES